MQRRLPYLLLTLIFPGILLFLAGNPVAAEPSSQTSFVTIGYMGEADSDLANGLRQAINEINTAGGITATDGNTYILQLQVAEVAPDDPDSVPEALTALSNASVIFGPDTNALALPNITTLSSATAPILTGARSASIPNLDSNNNIFQIVPQTGEYANALATYLVQDLNISDVVIVNGETGDDEDTTAAQTFSRTFSQLNVPPQQLIQVTDNSQIESQLSTVITLNPEVVVVFGDVEAANITLETLRSQGWDGLLVYRDAQRALAEDAELDRTLYAGVLGVDSWTYGPQTVVGRTFLSDYVQNFGSVPGPLAAAGYDSVYALLTIIRGGSTTPAAIRANLPQVRLTSLVSGPVNPASYGSRVMSRTVYVYEVTVNGGAIARAIYDAGVQRAGALVGGPVNGGDGTDPDNGNGSTIPTITPRPSSTSIPTVTLQPTITPGVLTATVNSNVGALRVREGPDTIYAIIDELATGESVVVIGRNAAFDWLFIQFDGRTGWIFREFVTLFDPGGQLAILPIIAPPSTPTPTVTLAPLEADLVVTNVTISPDNPQPNQAISAQITITNQGRTDAGAFAVATSFRPGEVYTAANLGGLAAGQSVTTTLTNTVTQTGYVPDLGIVVDLNNSVAEGTNGENNNLFTIEYKVDRAIVTESSAALGPSQSINFFGPDIDLTWDGNVMSVPPGVARIGRVNDGLDYLTTHYDVVTTYATTLTNYTNPQPGEVFGIITAEGDYGYLRIDNRNGSNLTFTYRIYDTP